jgi:P-type E1-E2 ATPase
MLNIPGRESLKIENVVFDYNGTLAVDGSMSSEVKDLLLKLKDMLNVHILTADTYGTVSKECQHLNLNVKTFPRENAGQAKEEIVKGLGGNRTVCIGNGFNDIQMLSEACLSVAVIGGEGCCAKLIPAADIVVNSIEDAFNLLLKSDRIKATLRN